jgi:large subunit ribosomal protein L31
MKKDIHPMYYADAKMTCSGCDSVFVSGSTAESLSIETCSQCHPFYTGKQKIVDTTGRVDRFKKISERAAQKKESRVTLQTKEQKEAKRKESKEAKQAA